MNESITGKSLPRILFGTVRCECCANPRPDTWWILRDAMGNFGLEIYCRRCLAVLGKITWREG